ncbi:hypothetical protein [Nocardia sp. NBC_01388]|uniref:hypothetical protein n=1 Tax=Nocardia sp. NBC_01388 TaxID=2903596 RepID=UPI0032496CAF
MRIGFGGKAFGVRAGVSTRGIGAGVGPLSAGAAWGGRRPTTRYRSSGGGGPIVALVGLCLTFLVAYLVVWWPFILGSWIAVSTFGAANPSTARTAVGWVCEAPWLMQLTTALSVLLYRYLRRVHASIK